MQLLISPISNSGPVATTLFCWNLCFNCLLCLLLSFCLVLIGTSNGSSSNPVKWNSSNTSCWGHSSYSLGPFLGPSIVYLSTPSSFLSHFPLNEAGSTPCSLSILASLASCTACYRCCDLPSLPNRYRDCPTGHLVVAYRYSTKLTQVTWWRLLPLHSECDHPLRSSNCLSSFW